MRRRSSDRSIRSRRAHAVLLVCAIALASMAWACGSEEPSTPEPTATPAEPSATPTETPAAPPAGAVPPAPSGAEGPEAFASEGVVPEGYPSDVPVYPGATPGSSMTMPGLGVFATFQSSDSVEKILEHYRAELSKGGWSVADTPDGSGLDGTKGARSVQVRARETEPGRSEIAINTSES